MVRSYFRTCAAGAVALGLAAAPAVVSAGPAEAPATAVTAPAAAPAVTAETAASLAATLDAGLRQWFPPTGSSATYRWDGRTGVTPAGDHYDADLPSLEITSDDGSRAVVGVIKLALIPNGDGSWGVGLSVPPQITLLGADGKPEGDVTIGSQRFFGRWLPSLNTFVKADGSYGDVRAASKKDGNRFEIGSLVLRTDLTEQPAGRWSGPSTLVLNKLVAVDEHGVQVARLGSAAIEASMSGMDLGNALVLGTQPAPPAAAGQPPAKEDAQAAVRRHLTMLHGLLGAASAKLRITDLTMTAPGDGSSFTIGQITLRGGIDGLDNGKSTLSLGYDHAGLKIEPNPGPREFTPEKVEFAVSATDLPNVGLWAALEKLLQPAPGQTDDQAGQQFLVDAQTALTQGGSKLRVDSLQIDTPATAATIKGEARFNNQSVFGIVANLDMVMRGLDAAMKQLQPAPGAKVDEDTQSTLALLSMVQVMGAPGKDASGRDIRTYKLELGADGKITLNGADMSALLGGGAAAPNGGGKPAAEDRKKGGGPAKVLKEDD